MEGTRSPAPKRRRESEQVPTNVASSPASSYASPPLSPSEEGLYTYHHHGVDEVPDRYSPLEDDTCMEEFEPSVDHFEEAQLLFGEQQQWRLDELTLESTGTNNALLHADSNLPISDLIDQDDPEWVHHNPIPVTELHPNDYITLIPVSLDFFEIQNQDPCKSVEEVTGVSVQIGNNDSMQAAAINQVLVAVPCTSSEAEGPMVEPEAVTSIGVRIEAQPQTATCTQPFAPAASLPPQLTFDDITASQEIFKDAWNAFNGTERLEKRLVSAATKLFEGFFQESEIQVATWSGRREQQELPKQDQLCRYRVLLIRRLLSYLIDCVNKGLSFDDSVPDATKCQNSLESHIDHATFQIIVKHVFMEFASRVRRGRATKNDYDNAMAVEMACKMTLRKVVFKVEMRKSPTVVTWELSRQHWASAYLEKTVNDAGKILLGLHCVFTKEEIMTSTLNGKMKGKVCETFDENKVQLLYHLAYHAQNEVGVYPYSGSDEDPIKIKQGGSDEEFKTFVRKVLTDYACYLRRTYRNQQQI